MKATISQLWETGRELINFDGDEFERPQSFADLKKCENVLLGDKIPGTKMREVLIDNSIVLVEPTTVRHPVGGTMYILEVLVETDQDEAKIIGNWLDRQIGNMSGPLMFSEACEC